MAPGALDTPWALPLPLPEMGQVSESQAGFSATSPWTRAPGGGSGDWGERRPGAGRGPGGNQSGQPVPGGRQGDSALPDLAAAGPLCRPGTQAPGGVTWPRSLGSGAPASGPGCTLPSQLVRAGGGVTAGWRPRHAVTQEAGPAAHGVGGLRTPGTDPGTCTLGAWGPHHILAVRPLGASLFSGVNWGEVPGGDRGGFRDGAGKVRSASSASRGPRNGGSRRPHGSAPEKGPGI